MKTRHEINYVTELKGCRTSGELFGTLEHLHEHEHRGREQ